MSTISDAFVSSVSKEGWEGAALADAFFHEEGAGADGELVVIDLDSAILRGTVGAGGTQCEGFSTKEE